MFELIVVLSRYLFVFYIIFFLYQGVSYITHENNNEAEFDFYRANTFQKIVIILMHLTGFLILSYEGGQFAFDRNTLIVGFGGLVFLLVAFFSTEKLYKDSSHVIWNSMLFLIDVGIIAIYRLNPGLAQKQLIWVCLGFLAMLFIPTILMIIPRFERLEKLYIVLGIIFILATFIFGREDFGSVNWIHIGSFSFQPSEIVKFLYIFYLASVFRKKVGVKELFITAILSSIIVLALVIQKDLGGALIFFMTFMIMVYISTSNEFLFFGGMGISSIFSFLAYHVFGHVRIRVSAWRNPWADIDRGGYQIVQSLFAIGTGGFLGNGLTLGMPKSIPVVEKDFIFSAICEEFGAIFGISIIFIFLLIFCRGMITALKGRRRYYSLLASGLICMMAFQTFLILGGVTKFIPLTGVTLPFLSYGGSSVVISIIMIGFLQWIETYYEQNCEKGGETYE